MEEMCLFLVLRQRVGAPLAGSIIHVTRDMIHIRRRRAACLDTPNGLPGSSSIKVANMAKRRFHSWSDSRA